MRIVMEDAMVQLLFTLEDLQMKVAVLEAKIERLECNAAELRAFSPAGLPAVAGCAALLPSEAGRDLGARSPTGSRGNAPCRG